MTFAIASKIAAAAADLDFLKNDNDPQRAAEAQKHINTLHACAIELAGNRAHELYATEAETIIDLPALARMTGCAAEGEVTWNT
jgi:hypothetical protein